MSLYYLDTSALVKYYVLEPGSTFVRGLVDDISNTISISDASIAESAAAFAILFRTHRISRRTQESAFHALMRDVARSSLKAMPLITIDFQLAAYLTQQHPLKAYDAVQLAVALRHNKSWRPVDWRRPLSAAMTCSSKPHRQKACSPTTHSIMYRPKIPRELTARPYSNFHVHCVYD